jgi:hypothetical protein
MNEWRMKNSESITRKRRARDSNPQGLAPAGFQDRCNSRSASSPYGPTPIRFAGTNIRNIRRDRNVNKDSLASDDKMRYAAYRSE